mmetsp:Transcript_19121/g.45582  ORF Transcript_19121/g.45582 Transcript_19121/m.45582 type:complete len:231 (-) Transcript_19121:1778-2470(-)
MVDLVPHAVALEDVLPVAQELAPLLDEALGLRKRHCVRHLAPLPRIVPAAGLLERPGDPGRVYELRRHPRRGGALHPTERLPVDVLLCSRPEKVVGEVEHPEEPRPRLVSGGPRLQGPFWRRRPLPRPHCSGALFLGPGRGVQAGHELHQPTPLPRRWKGCEDALHRRRARSLRPRARNMLQRRGILRFPPARPIGRIRSLRAADRVRKSIQVPLGLRDAHLCEVLEEAH